MKKIKLTQNQYALVNDEIFEQINQHKWWADKTGNTYYAVRKVTIQSQNKEKNKKSKIKKIYMHQEIIGRTLDVKEEIHHINEDGLDNRKENLMILTRLQHMKTRGKNKTKTSSIYKGVSWHKKRQKWRARIMVNRKEIFLGSFDNEIEAAEAYDIAALKYHGGIAKLNKALK